MYAQGIVPVVVDYLKRHDNEIYEGDNKKIAELICLLSEEKLGQL